MKAAPTLSDVAQMSGFSTATVSRCLNFPDQVSKKTRAKVMEAVSKLGYSPNFAAQAMAAKRTKTIGAIIPTMANAMFARGLQAFQEELGMAGYTMLVASSSYQAELEEQQIRALVARGADALLLIGHDRSAAITDFLEARGVPSLVTWIYDPSEAKPSVGFDNRAAMRMMAREVIGRGHRHLGFITARTERNDRARARLYGIHEAMVEAGLEPQDLMVQVGEYSVGDGAAAFKILMTQTDRPSAILCGNDVIAAGAIMAARAMGVAVPGDVSITGFDDIDYAHVTHPAVTTVHVPHQDMGKAAAERLISMVEGGGSAGSVELPTRLVLRGSLGPPKA